MKMSVWSLVCQQSIFQRYHRGKHLWEFYPQDGGESQLALKLRHCQPKYTTRNVDWSGHHGKNAQEKKNKWSKKLTKDRIANCLPGVPWAQRPKWEITPANSISVGSSVQTVQQTHTQTDTQTTLHRQQRLCTLCMRCGLIRACRLSNTLQIHAKYKYTFGPRDLHSRRERIPQGPLLHLYAIGSRPKEMKWAPHGRPHIRANGVSWPPPWKNGWKKQNMQKDQFSMFMLYFESNLGGQV